MKVATLTGSRAMSIVELPNDAPPPGNAKLRVAFCGICGSESANPPRALGFPQPVMGHEFSSRVFSLGKFLVAPDA